MVSLVNPKTREVVEVTVGKEESLNIIRELATRRRVGDRPEINDRQFDFVKSLYESWKRGGLSESQWFYVRVIANEHLYPTVKIANVESVGDFHGVTQLFESAKCAELKRPKIRFSLPVIGELRLSLAGPKSKFPGTINVTDSGSFGDNVWYGMVNNGEFIINPRVDEDKTAFVLGFLRLLAKSPAMVSGQYGKMSGRCCFCGIELTDPRSVSVGRGPICSEKFGLEWGHVTPDDAADVEEFTKLVGGIVA